MTSDDEAGYRQRQRGRARVTAVLLLAAVLLFFFITLARIKQGMVIG